MAKDKYSPAALNAATLRTRKEARRPAASGTASRSVRPRAAGFGFGVLLSFIVLLACPLFALWKVCEPASAKAAEQAATLLDWRIAFGIFAVLSLVSFIAMALDKKSAEKGQWRTPEKVLHGLEFFGGWPGSFLAQRIFWHKVSKTSYQIVFWFIVLVYEFVAIDYLLGWKCLRWLGAYL